MSKKKHQKIFDIDKESKKHYPQYPVSDSNESGLTCYSMKRIRSYIDKLGRIGVRFVPLLP